MLSPFMTHNEVIDFAKVSRKTLYRWCQDGRFPRPVRMGGLIRWRLVDIESWRDGLH